MAISHKDHDHPNTPAARAACRKRMNAGQSPRDEATERALSFDPFAKPAKLSVVPRKRRDGGVVSGLQATAPKAVSGNLKRAGTPLRTIADLPDVPQMLAYAARLAWAEGWDVFTGYKFNDEEATIRIVGLKAEITCIWRVTQPHGIWAMHLRRLDESKGCGAASSALEAIEMAAGRLPFPDGQY